VIKYGAIMDAAMVADLERGIDAILARDPAALEAMVARSLRHKAAVVSADERESGLRKTLNFGHTIGHALEASAGYGSYLHGEAVAIGMAVAANFSRAYAQLPADERARLVKLIERAGLPTALPRDWRGDAFLKALRLDKKRAGAAIEFILIDKLGHAFARPIEMGELLKRLG
jgi:3-dehydroquinate synthase